VGEITKPQAPHVGGLGRGHGPRLMIFPGKKEPSWGRKTVGSFPENAGKRGEEVLARYQNQGARQSGGRKKSGWQNEQEEIQGKSDTNGGRNCRKGRVEKDREKTDDVNAGRG